VQLLVETYLSEGGYQVLLAEDGKQAVEMALREQPDLVLMDLHMPVLDGYAAVRQLRQRGYSRPVVALSASNFPEDRRAALEAGCNGYLVKPLAMRELLEYVQNILQAGARA